MVLGILGTGHLASYTVAGLRHAGDRRRIILSPRNASTAAQLAEEHGCEVASSNQDVIDNSEVVLLSVRPGNRKSLLTGLQFKSNQLVISVMAGVSVEELLQFSNLSDVTLVRSLPIQCSAVGVGPVPLFPANEEAQQMLAALGSVVVLGSEHQFETASSIGCMHGWVYPWLAAMSRWAQEQGMESEAAGELTLAAVAGAVAYSQAQGPSSMAGIGDGIADEGTYTLAGLQQMQSQNAFVAWTEAMDMVAEKARQ